MPNRSPREVIKRKPLPTLPRASVLRSPKCSIRQPGPRGRAAREPECHVAAFATTSAAHSASQRPAHHGQRRPHRRLQPLLADLRDKEGGFGFERLDYLVLSGDLTNRATPEEFDKVYQLISRLIERFDLSAERCIIVPGNHDLSWDEQVYEWKQKRLVDPHKLPAGSFFRRETATWRAMTSNTIPVSATSISSTTHLCNNPIRCKLTSKGWRFSSLKLACSSWP